jgi:hypothetical protein
LSDLLALAISSGDPVLVRTGGSGEKPVPHAILLRPEGHSELNKNQKISSLQKWREADTEPGAGRPLGAVARINREAREKAIASGETPLDYMLRVMRDEHATKKRRDDMAKAAAPFVHARISAVAADETGAQWI